MWEVEMCFVIGVHFNFESSKIKLLKYLSTCLSFSFLLLKSSKSEDINITSGFRLLPFSWWLYNIYQFIYIITVLMTVKLFVWKGTLERKESGTWREEQELNVILCFYSLFERREWSSYGKWNGGMKRDQEKRETRNRWDHVKWDCNHDITLSQFPLCSKEINFRSSTCFWIN